MVDYWDHYLNKLWSNARYCPSAGMTFPLDAKVASAALQDYVRLLRIADLCNGNPARGRTLGSRPRVRREQPSVKYERALERLAELIDTDASLVDYLDRPFSMNLWYDGTIAADIESVTRIKYHAGEFVIKTQYNILKSIRQLKLEALQRAINSSRSTVPRSRRRIERFRDG